MAVKKVIELDVNTGDSEKDVKRLTGEIKKTEKQTEEVSKVTEGLTNKLDQMSGGAITGFRNMVNGAKAGVKSMKTLKVAISSTGIGLLVAAVATLITYFTQTQRGADLIDKAFSAIGATIDVLKDRISQFGEGLYLIFSGKFEKGAALLKASFSGVGEEIVNETKAAWKLTEAMKAVEDKEIELITVNERRRQKIAALRREAEELARTDKKAAAEKIKQSIAVEEQIFQSEFKLAKERARISKERLALGESTREDIRKNAELQAEVIRLETQRDERIKTYQTRLNSLLGVEKELTEEQAKRAKINAFQVDLETSDVKLDNQRLLEEQSLAISKEFAEKHKEVTAGRTSFEIWQERQLQNERVDAKKKSVDLIAQLTNSETSIGKAALIAKQLMHAQEIAMDLKNITFKATKTVAESQMAVAQGTAETAKVGFPQNVPLLIAYAAQAIGIFSAVKNAVSKAKSAGASAPGIGSPAAPSVAATPKPSFNIVGNSRENQLAGALNRFGNSPLRTYVVSREMTDQQELDRNIRQTASVG